MEALPTNPDLLLNHIGILLKNTFGSKVQIDEQNTLVRKHDYVVMFVRTSYPSLELLLKVAGANASLACPFEQSAFLHRLIAARTAIHIPEVFAADTSCEKWPWRYLIRGAVVGVEWAQVRDGLSMDEVANLHSQLGDAVAQLHGLSFPAFGEFSPTGEVLGGTSYLEALRNRARITIARPHLLSLFLNLLDEHIDLFINIDQPVLCHEDLHRHNILVEKRGNSWQLATILDFDKAWAGHSESDLARLELWDGMTSASFWQAYIARRGSSPLYEARCPIYQFMWCLEYAQQSEKHLGDTNQLCDQLGLPHIERFD